MDAQPKAEDNEKTKTGKSLMKAEMQQINGGALEDNRKTTEKIPTGDSRADTSMKEVAHVYRRSKPKPYTSSPNKEKEAKRSYQADKKYKEG